MYHKAKLSELNYFQISREIRIHSQLDHQNILQLVWTLDMDLRKHNNPQPIPVAIKPTSRVSARAASARAGLRCACVL